MKTVAIAGVSGFVGTHLKNHFIKQGFSVSGISIETYKDEPKLLSILEVLYGEGSVVLLDGSSVKPKRLLENGFKFDYPTIEKAIEDLVG